MKTVKFKIGDIVKFKDNYIGAMLMIYRTAVYDISMPSKEINTKDMGPLKVLRADDKITYFVFIHDGQTWYTWGFTDTISQFMKLVK
jgi:hypothetical protein